MDEIWKPITGTDYAVSNTGKIASMKKGWKVLKPAPNSDGYLQVVLCHGGIQRSVTVHKLVAEAFLGPRPTPKHQVNHKDGVKTNPDIENLEWVTSRENTQHGFDILGHRHVGIRGEANNFAKLTETEAREILRRCKAGELQRVIAADYGIGKSAVGMIARRKTWGWLV